MELDVARSKLRVAAGNRCKLEQDSGGQQKTQNERYHAEGDCRDRTRALQMIDVAQALAVRGVVKARPRTRDTFYEQQQKNKAEQECGELGGSDRIAQREPCVEYAGRKRLHAKIGNGPEIREGLHQRQRGAGDDARTRERSATRRNVPHVP